MASRRGERKHQCRSKKKHQTLLSAQISASRISKKIKQKLVAYRCGNCGLWHVGHPPRWVQRKLGNP